MRSALICAGVMLAMLLLWPIAFAGPAAERPAPPAAATVTLPIPPPTLAVIRVAARPRPFDAPVAGGPSCFARYQSLYDSCAGDEAKACRLIAIERWDICETTGRWTGPATDAISHP
ncbi:MAG: hypothetical protein V4537_05985 [Pseudomonadota bacterium]